MSPADLLSAAFASPVVLALGWTLVHFLWQGLLLAALYGLGRHLARDAGPALRYWLGMGVLGAMLLGAGVTFALVYAPDPASVVPGSLAAAAITATVVPEGLAGLHAVLEPVVPWAVLAWLLGVIAHGVGLAGDYRALRQITAGARPLPSPWPEMVDRIRRQLGIRRVVRVIESVRVGVPIVVGWLRPVIIIPPSAILGLTPRQLELIISHELAHVARLDYVFNLAQILVETLFFFHPAVRYVSRRVRQERENCCDDAVVARTGETLAYARALAEIEGLRCSAGLRPATAATGGHLKGRISRLVALPAPQRGSVSWLAGLALLGVGAGAVFGGARFAAEQVEPTAVPPPVDVATAPAAPTAPSAPAAPAAPAAQAPRNPEPLLARVPDSPSPPAPEAVAPAPATTTATTAPQPPPDRSDRAAAPAPRPVAASARETIPEPAVVSHRAEAPASPVPADVAAPLAALPSAPAATRETPAPPPSPAPPVVLALATGAAPPAPAAPAAPTDVPAEVPAAPDPVAPPPPAEVAPPPPAEVTPAPAPELSGGELIRSPAPAYPRRARVRGVEGQVTVRYSVNERGRVDGFDVLSAEPGKTFVAAVRKAVRRWRHEPFLQDGEPVAATVTRTFEFAIRAEQVAASDASNPSCRRVTGSRLCRSGDPYQELGVVVVHNPL